MQGKLTVTCGHTTPMKHMSDLFLSPCGLRSQRFVKVLLTPSTNQRLGLWGHRGPLMIICSSPRRACGKVTCCQMANCFDLCVDTALNHNTFHWLCNETGTAIGDSTTIYMICLSCGELTCWSIFDSNYLCVVSGDS